MCCSINAAYKRFVLAASLSSGPTQSFPGKFKALQASPSCQGPMLLSQRHACSPVCRESQIVSSQVALLSHNESSFLSLRIWKPGFSSSSLVMHVPGPSHSASATVLWSLCECCCFSDSYLPSGLRAGQLPPRSRSEPWPWFPWPPNSLHSAAW